MTAPATGTGDGSAAVNGTQDGAAHLKTLRTMSQGISLPKLSGRLRVSYEQLAVGEDCSGLPQARSIQRLRYALTRQY